jgi:extracellular elastinolytic metalloproteinase
MKFSRHRSARFARTLLVLAPAVMGCTEPPVDTGGDDEGRVTLGGSSLENRNFDARVSHNARLPLTDIRVTPRLAGRLAAPGIAASFDPRTGATRTLQSRTGFLTEASSGSAESIALDFVRGNPEALGLSPSDLDGMEVTDVVYSRPTGVTHIYYRQRHLDLPVYNGQLQVNVHGDGRILSVNNAFVPNIAAVASSTSPALSADRAVMRAAANLSVKLVTLPKVLSASLAGADQRTLLEAAGLSTSTVESQLMWMPVNGAHVALAWRFQVETPDGNHHFDYTVDAQTGKVWTRFDWAAADSYRVFREPVESANHSSPAQPADGRVVVNNPADSLASPLGWHNNGSTTFRIHRGNNVHAYDDRDANNAPPRRETNCTQTRDCNFAVSFTNQPSSYTAAAVTNLFYWNNLIHDVQYHYGFDEISGNFQVNNFGKGGSGNDAVRAEAQDGSFTNNANFATPPDGLPPRMQMFEWTVTNPRRDGDFDNGIIVHEYAHGITNRLVGGPSNVSCLNNLQQGGEGWSDWYALWYTARPDDTAFTGRGLGSYALGQARTGPGIRLQRYSTSPAINNHTYESIQGKVVPHGVGEVWAQALWEVYWALVDRHGYSPNLTDALGAAGNQRAMLYVTEGLKNTVCSPSFIDARDGIIAAAASVHEGEDVCLLWSAFAGFGLGVDAFTDSSDGLSPSNGFQVPEQCGCDPAPVADVGPDRAICRGNSVTLGPAAQPGTSYLWSPGGQTTAQITVSPTETTAFTLTASNSCGSTSDAAIIRVDVGAGGSLSDTFENGIAGWTATGLWHLVNSTGCASPGFSSPTHSFYYGIDTSCSYNNGAATFGQLTSPQIANITSNSTLSFDFFREVETFPGQFDRTLVEVIRSNGAATTVFLRDSSNASVPEWVSSGEIPLAPFAGDTVRVRFTFDSIDAFGNTFRGWLVDNVVVTSGSACTALSPTTP